jgi:hypothetical protein
MVLHLPNKHKVLQSNPRTAKKKKKKKFELLKYQNSGSYTVNQGLATSETQVLRHYPLPTKL